MKKILDFFTLFASLSTLICCALPALLVTLGLGSALAGLFGQFPQLAWASEYKLWIFLTSGLLLVLAGLGQWRASRAPCPIGPKAEACQSTRAWSKWIYFLSLFIYLIGLSFAYILPAFAV